MVFILVPQQACCSSHSILLFVCVAQALQCATMSSDANTQSRRRTIRSFVRRAGRLTPSQQRALEEVRGTELIPSSEMAVIRSVAPTVAAVIDRLVAVTHPKRSVRALDRSAKGCPVSGCRQEVPKRQAEMRGAISKSVGSALMKALYAAAMFDETPSESAVNMIGSPPGTVSRPSDSRRP